jgi:diguanylate cyclase
MFGAFESLGPIRLRQEASMTLKISKKDQRQDQIRLAASIFAICLICVITLFELFKLAFPSAPGAFPIFPLAIASLCALITGAAVVNLIDVRARIFHDEVDRVRFLVRHDGLTGALNRTSFIDEMRGSGAAGQLLIIDADHFKAINDSHGHYTGDKALMQLAKVIQMAVGAHGLTGRLGGEEFGVFLPDTDSEAANMLAEQIRRMVEREGFHANGVKIALTVSIGLSAHDADSPVGNAFKHADRRLYAAKSLGRNRIVAHEPVHNQLREEIEAGLKAAVAVTTRAA